MLRQFQPTHLNLQVFAEDGEPFLGSTPLVQLERLASDAAELAPDASAQWQVRAEFRPRSGTEDALYLHLKVTADVPTVCQRCMAAMAVPVEVDQHYRFVATEDIAMAEDDESEEDLLVMTPQFDLLTLIEDELLLALPLVPMHDHCPTPLAHSLDSIDSNELSNPKPQPFAALRVLKKKSDE